METSNPLLSKLTDLSRDREITSNMNLQGVVNKTGILLLLCFASGAFAWLNPGIAMPLALVGFFGGLVTFFIAMFSPRSSGITAPIYAICEGLVLGAISYLINAQFRGIVANAMLLTTLVLVVMLFLYTTRIIRVTQRMVQIVTVAMISLCLVYVVDLVMNLFGAEMPYLHSSGPIGIIISLVIVGLASFRLLINFAVIENNIRLGSPKYLEWYCGMGLLVSLVWLYLEILELLMKMQGRRN
jgi:uncharacterized YccA/Bax inhibitor family protein